MYKLIRLFLFCLPAEFSHVLGLKGLNLLYRLGLAGLLKQPFEPVPVDCLGLKFKNPVGLAAGLDKNGDYIDALGALGFGFIEVGTVTPKAQPGNPKPRLFRLRRHQALINRMGFNNKGVDHLVSQLRKRRYSGVIGVNIGKNLTTPVERATEDYLSCLRKVYACADYVVVNLSSPNTPGLRELQFGQALRSLLQDLTEENRLLAIQHGKTVPLLLKIAPDLTKEEVEEIAAAVSSYPIAGLIATNTTISRDQIKGDPLAEESGGLSGGPLLESATDILTTLKQCADDSLALIGVGGIVDAKGATIKFQAGADLVQIYSGFIYRGPVLIREAASAARMKP